MPDPSKTFHIFVIYAREDLSSLKEFRKSLATLERRKEVRFWYDGEIIPGQPWEKAIKDNLKQADIIVLLLSPDFFSSDYIHSHELTEALSRHREGTTEVVPVILRHCLWKEHPDIAQLQVLPDNAVPVSSKKHWDDTDEAYTNVAAGMSKLIKKLTDQKTPVPPVTTDHAPTTDHAANEAITDELRRAAEAYDNEKYETAFEIFIRYQHSPLFTGEFQRRLGRMYNLGQFVSKDYTKAKFWYEKAIENGDSGAMNNLGVMYNNGEGVSQDYQNAKECYEKAAEKGNTGAMNNLGLVYKNGEGVIQDYQKAKEWFEKAAQKGDAAAMTNLGFLYYNGQGITQDFQKAKEWYEKAVQNGNSGAMNKLGVLYQNGQGVIQNYQKAKEWYEKAVQKGNIDAMTNLGLLYYNGQGITQDYQKAKEWYEKAVQKGSEAAMTCIGVLHHDGKGVTQDYQKAKEWYEKAAEKNETAAMRNLAILYRYGRGVAQSYQIATEWYKKAYALGDEKALEEMKDMLKNQ
jgi:TPR repeat protein